MARVRAIFCHDTWGENKVEAESAGPNALMDSTIAHVNNPIQIQSLRLVTAMSPFWTSNTFTVVGDRFAFGFWLHINAANMGVAGSQKIISIYTDGGTNPDIELLHTSNFSSAGFDWDLVDADGFQQISVTDPFNEDKWVWCTLYYLRHASVGNASLFLHNDYPSTSKTLPLTMSGVNTEGSGASTSAVVQLSGHIAIPAGGAMTVRFGGGYFMDGITNQATEILDHQEFHSLRPEKASATPDVDWDGSAVEIADNLDAGIWSDAGDQVITTVGEYTGGLGQGGAVQTEDYNLSTTTLNGDHNIGKFIYSTLLARFASGAYVYGYYNASTGTYSVANSTFPGGGSARNFEHVIYSGDLQWPVMSNVESERSIPVIGFRKIFGSSASLREAAFVKMWPKNPRGVHKVRHLINNVSVIRPLVGGGLAR